jgi:large repetitive protein
MNTPQPEFNSLLLGQVEPLTTVLPWEKGGTFTMDVTRLRTPLLPLVAADQFFTTPQSFLAADPYLPAISGINLLANPIASPFGVPEAHIPGCAGVAPAGKTLSELLIQETKQVAIAEWVSVGISEADRAVLESVQITVTDLPSQILGQANGYQISIDNDAAGQGWDIDLNPLSNVSTGKQQVDLLTLVTHEFGHVLGFGHSAQGIMGESLSVGIRIAPTTQDLNEPRRDIATINLSENGVAGFVPDRDLLVATPPVVPGQVRIGQSLGLNWLVKNNGTVDINQSFFNNVYLSDDDIFDAPPVVLSLTLNTLSPLAGNTVSDKFLGSSYLNGLLAGQQSNVTSSIVIPKNATPGNKYLIFVADGYSDLAETNEQNNYVAVPITVLAPDLAISNFTVPVSGLQGTNIEVNWSLINKGAVDSPPGYLYDSVVLSKDNILGNNDDISLGNLYNNHGALTSTSPAFTGKNNVYLPYNLEGDYNLFFIADFYNGQGDTDRSNNVSNPTPIKISSLDALRPDFSIQGTAPTQLQVGQTLPLSWAVTNISDTDNAYPTWVDTVYLSDDTLLDATDFVLTSATRGANTPAVLPGGSYSISKNVVLPSTIGSKYLIFATDSNNNRTESNESNNLSIIPFQITAPDLVSSLGTAKLSNRGQTIDLTWQVSNLGTGSTIYNPSSPGWQDSVYLSADNVFDSNDILIGDIYHNYQEIVTNGSYINNLSVYTANITASGLQNLLFITDRNNQQREANEINNIFAVPAEIQSSDIVVSNFVAPAQVSAEEVVNVSWTISNQGTNQTDSGWRDQLYLSQDEVISVDDIQLADLGNASVLQIGDSYTVNTQVVFPQVNPNQSWKLLLKADTNSYLSESNKINNFASRQIRVTASDLQIGALGVTGNGTIYFGSNTDFTWTVNNIGSSANKSWHDRLYLSRDNQLSSEDLLLKDEVRLVNKKIDPFIPLD